MLVSAAVVVNAVVAVALTASLFADNLAPRIEELDLDDLCSPASCWVFAYGLLWSAVAATHAVRHFVCCEPAMRPAHWLAHGSMWGWSVVLAYRGVVHRLIDDRNYKLTALLLYTLAAPLLWGTAIVIRGSRPAGRSSGTGGAAAPLLPA